MSEKKADLIAKLLAKAESTTPEEAEALREHAYRLMEKYMIDQAVIDARRARDGQASEKIVTRIIEFDGGYAIIKMRPPQETLGFTLEQSQLRRKYGVTVVGVKSPGQDFTYAVPSTKVMQGDTLIVAGKTELLEQLASRP